MPEIAATTADDFSAAVTLIDEATAVLARRYKAEGRGPYKALLWPQEYQDTVLRLARALTAGDRPLDPVAMVEEATSDAG